MLTSSVQELFIHKVLSTSFQVVVFALFCTLVKKVYCCIVVRVSKLATASWLVLKLCFFEKTQVDAHSPKARSYTEGFLPDHLVNVPRRAGRGTLLPDLGQATQKVTQKVDASLQGDHRS